MKKLILIAFLFLYCYSFCQSSYLPHGFRKYVTDHCLICNKKPADSVKFIYINNQTTNADISFHNCHVFYYKGTEDSAYKYALYTLSLLKTSRGDKRNVAAKIINAKILYSKNLLTQSLTEFLNISGDSLLEADVKSYLDINIGSIYADLEDYTHAIPYLESAINKHSLKDSISLRIAYNNIGLCYLCLKKIKKAEYFFDKSITVAKRLRDTLGLAYLYTNIANQYYEQYQDQLAIKYFTAALHYALSSKDFVIKQIAYQNMAVISENKKDYKSAVAYRKFYEEQHDSLYNRDNVWGTAEEKNKLDSQLHAREVELAVQKNKLQGLELDKQRGNFFIALCASLAFLSFFLFAYYGYRQKNKQNTIITVQREQLNALNHTKDQLFSVVAHDLRTPVQTLRVTLNKLKKALHNQNISEAEQVSIDIENISNGTYSLLNNLLYWALSQTGQLHLSNHKLNMGRVVRQVLFDYEPVAAAKQIKLENRVNESLHCSGDINTVKVILRNLVDNAIKFSEPNTDVTILGEENEKECIISVTDKGEGIDNSVIQALKDSTIKRVSKGQAGVQSTGIGLWLVKTMTERNGGSLHIERQIKGTKINIHLPLYRNHEQTADTYC